MTVGNIDFDKLQSSLCEMLCRDVRIERHNDLRLIDLPLYFPDGDAYQIYIEENGAAGVRLTDKGNVTMRLSYEMDVADLYKGTRDVLRRQILSDLELHENERGQIYLDTAVDNLPEAIFSFGQGLTRIYDLLMLSRERVASTFYDDLRRFIFETLGEDRVQADYEVPELDSDKRELYPVDYFWRGTAKPVYAYGIPNRDKARLATICLEHFNASKLVFDSLLIFEGPFDGPSKVPTNDLERVLNAGGEAVFFNSKDDARRKILAKAEALA